jgi:hypothetical protein
MRRAYDGAIGSGLSRVKQFAMISSSSTSSDTNVITYGRGWQHTKGALLPTAAGGTKNLSSVRYSICASLFEIRQSSRKTEKGCHFLSFLHLFLYFSCSSHPPKLGDREEVA